MTTPTNTVPTFARYGDNGGSVRRAKCDVGVGVGIHPHTRFDLVVA